MRRGWIPVVLAILAFASAAAFSAVEDPAVRRPAAFSFALCLGGALTLWGLEALDRGRIRGRRVTVHRKRNPIAFWGIVVLARFFPGLAMIAAAFWHLFARDG